MSETIQINARGSMTLPKSFRKKLGLENGGVVMAECSGDGIILKPAVSFPVEIYSDSRVAEFDAAEQELGSRLSKKGLEA
ncbi:MAG: AbrB/MazE/SpoVT family DNA-binding domain-containing protein [Chitinispirillaceae bacterium]|jgi:AbrB family looped-hinge helix DNA binding protein|nr:AbrB/MazE/SpoVT family DNA-binding domain-containing protein [Chitinispirillaceae bacterium]